MATLPDYSINVAQPFMEALKGYQLGMGFESAKQQNILQLQQAQQALQQQQALQDAQRLVFQKPNAENYARLMTLDPKSSEAYQRAWSTRNTAQQETLAADLLKQGAAITSGKPKIAAQYLEDKASAIEAQNNGQPTPESQAVRTQARLMKEHPEFALGQIQALLAVNPLGKQAFEALAKFGEEARTAQVDAKFREIMAGAKTVDDVFARIPQLAQLGEKGVEHAERLLTQQRLREQQAEVIAAGKAKRGETLLESTRAISTLNTLIAGTTKENPAFKISEEGEVTENPSFWEKFAFIPTAGGPPMAVPGKSPVAPIFDETKAAALGLDAPTLELVKAQIELSPKEGAKLLSQIISANIKQKLAIQKPETLSAHAKMLVESGMVQGSPEFKRAMAAFVRAKADGASKGEGVTITNVMGEKAAEAKGREFGQFAQKALEKAQSSEDTASDVSMIVEGMRGMGGGPVAQFKAWAGQFLPAESEWGKIASMSELSTTIQAKLAPTMREAGSGATSDIEMKSFMRAIPTLATSERGRELMAKYARRLSDRAQIRAEVVNDIEASGRLPTPSEIKARMRLKIGDVFFDAADRTYFGIKPAGAAPAPAPGAQVSVTAPNGQVLTFPSQQAADAFKKAAGIR